MPRARAARIDINSLINVWDDALLDRLAAMNLVLDRSKERRRAEFAKLRETVGFCRDRPGYLYSENALRGDWMLDCERGTVQVSVTLDIGFSRYFQRSKTRWPRAEGVH